MSELSSPSLSLPPASTLGALAPGLAVPARLAAGLAAQALVLGPATSSPSSSALVVSKSVSDDGRDLAANMALMLPFPLAAGLAAVAFTVFAAADEAVEGLYAVEGLGGSGGFGIVAFLGTAAVFLAGAKSSSSESLDTSESEANAAFLFFFAAFFGALPA
jgi:hypothetical protein